MGTAVIVSSDGQMNRSVMSCHDTTLYLRNSARMRREALSTANSYTQNVK